MSAGSGVGDGSPRRDAPDGPTVPTSGIRLVRWTLARHSAKIAVGAIAGIVWMGAGAAIPVALGVAVDRVERAGPITALIPSLVLIAAVLTAQGAASVVRHHSALWLSHHSQWSIEQLVTSRVLDRRGGFTGSTGRLVSLATSDTAAVGDIANLMCRGIGAVVTFVVVAVMLIVTEWRIGLIAVVGMPLSLAALSLFWHPARERATSLQTQRATVSATAADLIGGLRVIKGLGGEGVARRWFGGDNDRIEYLAVDEGRVRSAWMASSMVGPGLILAAILWIAGPLVVDGDLTPGDLVAVTGLAVWLRVPLDTLSEVGQVWVAGLASAQRLTDVLNRPMPAAETDVRRMPGHVPRDGSIVLRDVDLTGDVDLIGDVDHSNSVGHLDDAVVRACPRLGVRFAVADGEHVGIVCLEPRSAGHLVDILGGMRIPARGSVEIGGVDLRHIDLDELVRFVGVERQHGSMFAGSVGENVALASPEAPHQELLAALVAAAADDVLAAPDGLDRRLGERGSGLSGGQRQRVALARRLVGDPPIVVLHDPTSALDVVTEQRVAERLRRHRAGRTTIVITTSGVLLRSVDRVIVIDRCHVAATGTHGELITSSADYRRVVGA